MFFAASALLVMQGTNTVDADVNVIVSVDVSGDVDVDVNVGVDAAAAAADDDEDAGHGEAPRRHSDARSISLALYHRARSEVRWKAHTVEANRADSNGVG